MTNEHEYQTGILGAGWLGLPLARVLQESGQRVVVTVSSAEKAEQLRGEGIAAWPLLLAPEMGALPFRCHDLVICVPPSKTLDYPASVAFKHMGEDISAATKGKFASLYGIPDVSPLAELMGLERDLALVAMTGARYHADQVTVAASLPALGRARDAGLDVTAGISIHHLTLNEYDVGGYRTFFRFTPPLRSEDDRLAMIEAVAGGVIDIIASFHTPQDEESKRLPFAEAAPGAVGLQTLLPAAMRLYQQGGLSLPQLWRAMSLNPAKRLGLDAGRLGAGAPADLVLFDPDAPFVLDRFTLRSKSKNTPFDGARMEGRVLGTWVAGQRVYGGEP